MRLDPAHQSIAPISQRADVRECQTRLLDLIETYRAAVGVITFMPRVERRPRKNLVALAKVARSVVGVADIQRDDRLNPPSHRDLPAKQVVLSSDCRGEWQEKGTS